LERIIVPGSNPFDPAADEVTEEEKVLFAFTKDEHQFSRGELFRLLDSVYEKLCKNYRDWLLHETAEY
jgi:hypothetical protein